MKYILIIFICCTSAFGQEWNALETKNPCTNRHENALVGFGNSLVLVGGRGVKPVEVFEINKGTWIKKAATPIEIHHFQAVVFKKELWILGAFTGNYPHETPIPNIYIYNFEKDEWRVGPEIPKDRLRGSAGVFVYHNKIYMVCGILDGHWAGHVSWLDEYDPKTNTWRKLADAPHARDHFQAAVIDNKIYVAGGRRTSAKTNEVLTLTESAVDVYDFNTNSWATLPADSNLPTARAGTSSVVFNEKLMVIGGESTSQKESHAQAEIFNTKTQKWETSSNLKSGRHGTGAVLLKDKIYVVAGSGNRGGGPELNTIEVFKINKKIR